MKNLIVATTAINRPELHNENMKEWCEWIKEVNKKVTRGQKQYNITWFINIDNIDELQATYKETRLNLRSLIKDVEITFLRSEDNKGNFLKACQRVAENIENYVSTNNLNLDETLILWLEDDWKLNQVTKLPLREIIDCYVSNLTHVNFSFVRNNYIHALAPGIMNYNLWKRLHYSAWTNQKSHIDPEHCVGLYYNSNFPLKQNDLFNLTVITKHKKTGKDFYEKSKFLNYKNSFYTYHEEKRENSIIKENYIHKSDIIDLEVFKDKPLFVRITCGLCEGGVNWGRDFMKKQNLVKKRIQNNSETDFYKKS